MEGSKDSKVEIRFSRHPSEDVWEEYAFGRLDDNESRLASLEEHLLVCTQCQETLGRVDTFIATMKSAGPVPVQAAQPGFWSRLFVSPRRVAIAFGTAVLVVGVAVAAALYPSRDGAPLGPVAVVALQSFRGDEGQTAPVGRPLELSVPAADVAAGAAFRLEVVTTSGTQVWKGEPGIKLVPKGLNRGTYFVRLYGSGGELLREYTLRVGPL